jgi:hypothetical protein
MADSGRYLSAPDTVTEPTILVVLDLPDIGLGRHDVPTLQVAACQVGASWRRVPLEVTVGGEVRTVSTAPAEAIIGTTLSSLGDGDSLDVELADPEHWLESRDAHALSNGANLAAVGSELIQFGGAVPIGESRFRLSGVVRGVRGSEWAMTSHTAGENFVLIAPGTLQEIVLPSALGSTASVKARGLADQDAVPVDRIVTGEAMRPPAPVELQGQIESDGALSLTWVRRSRLSWTWTGADVPLGESAERYEVTIEHSTGTLTFQTSAPSLVASADALAGVTGSVMIGVVQVGDFAKSRPATLPFDLGC